MTYEDVIRVADLKTRRDRFATVRNETRAKSSEPIYITEYLKPGPEEICALLPKWLGDAFLNYLRKRGLEHRFNNWPLYQVAYDRRLSDHADFGEHAFSSPQVLALR